MRRVKRFKKNPGERRAACLHTHREGGCFYKQTFIIANQIGACYSVIAVFLWQASDRR
jgi:uncharacterized membrane protein YesL